jgi:hypothetical protein
MPTLTGRWMNMTKNADGSISCEFAQGIWPLSMNRFVMTFTAADATAIGAVVSGGTGTTSLIQHPKEVALHGNVDH